MLTYLTPIGEESISTPVVGGEQCISLLISGHENQMNSREPRRTLGTKSMGAKIKGLLYTVKNLNNISKRKT